MVQCLDSVFDLGQKYTLFRNVHFGLSILTKLLRWSCDSGSLEGIRSKSEIHMYLYIYNISVRLLHWSSGSRVLKAKMIQVEIKFAFGVCLLGYFIGQDALCLRIEVDPGQQYAQGLEYVFYDA